MQFLASNDFGWLNQNILSVDHASVSKIKGLNGVLDIKKMISDQEMKIKLTGDEIKTLESHQNEIRKNITAFGEGEHANNAKNQLANNDKRLQELRNKFLDGTKELDSLAKEFEDAMRNMSLAWQE